MSELLKANQVRKIYPSGDRTIAVLEDVDFSISEGESVSIRGESGSGKSTLLNLLAGLDQPDTGTVRWLGREVDHSVRGKDIGIIFQSFYLIPELNALENVLMARRILGRVREEDRSRAKDLLARVGLAERAHHLPTQLSGGERQRVAVARALINEPRLILADEPTGNLDEKSGEVVIEILLRLCSETSTALVLVTHNAAHAERAQRRFHLVKGVLHAVQ